MLNRRILRIKAFKSIFSYAENPDMTLKEVLAQTDKSCESTRDLYLFLLGIVCPLTEEAKNRAAASMAKFNPTEEEKHPNLKFINNRIAPILAQDPDFSKIFAKKKFDWSQYDVLIRHVYDNMKASDYFRKYMASETSSLKEDAALWADIFAAELEFNPELEAIIEDLSIWWNDDLSYALNWCCRTFDSLGEGERWDLPALYLSEIQNGNGSDREFIRNIVTKACNCFKQYYDEVAANTKKWDKNRICPTDLALIIAGVAEHESCPDIPAGVTINEFVEISKFYSTPESRAFVNGLLDKLINNR